MSIPKELMEHQREYNRLSSFDTIGRPRTRMTRWERVLCYIALMWPTPFAQLAAAIYLKRRKSDSIETQETR